MKKTRGVLLTLTLAAWCVCAQAEWTEIQQFDDGMRVFVDPGRIRHEGETVVLQHLVHWGEPQQDEGIYPYQSTLVRTAYDCAEKRERYLGSVSYAGPMGNGAKVTADDNEAEVWYSISEGSMEEKLWKLACERK